MMGSFTLRRARDIFWTVGGAASAASVIAFFVDKRGFWISYLEAYWLWIGISLGCLGIWMLHTLVGGQWGDPISRVVQAGARVLPLMVPLFLPIVFGMGTVFHWTDSAHMAADEALSQKTWYLNTRFFIGRAIAYFMVWLILLNGQRRRSEAANNDLTNPRTMRLQNWSGGGALILFFTASFAAVDWVLSIEPYFYSTIWGALTNMAMLLGAFAYATLGAVGMSRLGDGTKEPSSIPDIKLNDLANLLLMSVILWMYMTFAQYLIVWSGQIKNEISWYNIRFVGGWQWFGGALLLFNFAVPFCCLLFRRIKRKAAHLSMVAALLFVMQWVESVWLIGPSFSPMAVNVNWATFVLPLAIGGIWLGSVSWLLERGIPPFPRGNAEEVAHYAA